MQVEGDAPALCLLGRDRLRDEAVALGAVLVGGPHQPLGVQAQSEQVGQGLDPGEVVVREGPLGAPVDGQHAEDLTGDAARGQAHPGDPLPGGEAEQLPVRSVAR